MRPAAVVIIKLRAAIADALKKSGRWLMKRYEPSVHRTSLPFDRAFALAATIRFALPVAPTSDGADGVKDAALDRA